MIQIDGDFPGGNIILERIEGDDILLRPDMRDTEGSWFYWAFRLRGGAGRRLNVHFTAHTPVGMTGPAVSLDQGRSWLWQSEAFTTDSFTLRVPAGCDDLRLAFSLVYTQADWDRFIATLPPAADWKADVLCKTRQGRDVELLHLGAPEAAAEKRVVITARHHCCEMIANYTMEGLIAAILGDGEAGAWLRRHVRFLFIPFADKDGVEAGDQGKNRKPRDHNRDYVGESVHVETAAIRALLTRWAQRSGVDAAIDLHCPWIRGAGNDIVFQVGREAPKVWAEQNRFGRMLETVVSPDGLPYRVADNLAFGQGWNTAGNYNSGMSFSRWAEGLDGMKLPTSFEIPYASAGGVAVTADRARRLGRDIATALADYFRK
jgi:hypothetical protein